MIDATESQYVAEAAALAAEVDRLRTLLRDLARLRWAIHKVADADTLRAVTPAALEARLAASGCTPGPLLPHRWRDWFHPTGELATDVPQDASAHDYPLGVLCALARITGTREGSARSAELLAELLPTEGPWNDDAGGDRE